MDWIDEYLKAFAKTVAASSNVGWFPFNWYRFCPYIADLDFLRWEQIIESAKKNVSIADLAKTYQGPLTPRFEIHYLMYECKAAGMSNTQTGKKVINFLNELCRKRCVEDFYGYAAAKIHSPKEVETILSNTKWEEIKDNQNRLVGNLIMAGIHLAYAYFSDYFYSAPCFELCGPYPLPNGKQLIIRKYKSFYPVEIWPQGPFPKFKSMEIFTIYDAPEIIVDQWSHISSTVNLALSLKRTAILVDGQWVPITKTPPLVEDLAQSAADIQNQWKKMRFEEIKQLMLNLRWYQFKPLLDFLGLPWKPTEKMQERIKNVQLLPEVTPNFRTTEAAQKWWSEFIDPRIKNLPASYIKPWEKIL